MFDPDAMRRASDEMAAARELLRSAITEAERRGAGRAFVRALARSLTVPFGQTVEEFTSECLRRYRDAGGA